MKTLRGYVNKSFYVTFVATVAVLTFIISIGGLFKITDLLARGIEAGPVLRVFLSELPTGLAYAVPVSALTAALLVFGRLSADHEVTAMRACGISIGRVGLWLLPFGVVASLLCVYVNSELLPLKHFVRWQATSELKADAAIELLEVGRTVVVDEGLRVYVGGRDPEGGLEDIRIFDQRDPEGAREIKAERGRLADAQSRTNLALILEQVTIDPFAFDSPGAAYSERWRVQLATREKRPYHPRDKDQSFSGLYLSARLLELEASRLDSAAWMMGRANEARQAAYLEAEDLRLGVVTLQEQIEEYRGAMDAVAADRREIAEAQVAALRREVDEVLARALQIEAAAGELARVKEREAKELRGTSVDSPERLRRRAMEMRIELNQRLLMSLSVLLFLYFGIPMGIRPHRRESSIGIAMSLGMVFCFYILMTLMEELADQAALRPDLLTWVPGGGVLVADVVLFWRQR